MNKSRLLSIYETCYKTRLLDERLQQAYFRDGARMQGFFSGIGTEIGQALVAGLLLHDDYLVPHYRDYAAVIQKGMPLDDLVALLRGKKAGPSKRIYTTTLPQNIPHNIYGTSIILGINFSIAVGLALAKKMKGEPGIVVQFFGDGTASRSTFGSALNLASLLDLPMLFVCHNDGVSIESTIRDTSSTPTIAERAQGYAIQAETVSSAEPLTLYERAERAVAFVRENAKPYLFEIAERRFPSHAVRYSAEPFLTAMIPTGEDPLNRFAKALRELQIPDADIEQCEQNAKNAVDKAFMRAEASSPVPENELYSVFHE